MKDRLKKIRSFDIKEVAEQIDSGELATVTLRSDSKLQVAIAVKGVGDDVRTALHQCAIKSYLGDEGKLFRDAIRCVPGAPGYWVMHWKSNAPRLSPVSLYPAWTSCDAAWRLTHSALLEFRCDTGWHFDELPAWALDAFEPVADTLGVSLDDD